MTKPAIKRTELELWWNERGRKTGGSDRCFLLGQTEMNTEMNVWNIFSQEYKEGGWGVHVWAAEVITAQFFHLWQEA